MKDPATISEALYERSKCYARLERLDRILGALVEQSQERNRDALWGSELAAGQGYADLGTRIDHMSEQMARALEVVPHITAELQSLAEERRAAGRALAKDISINAAGLDNLGRKLDLLSARIDALAESVASPGAEKHYGQTGGGAQAQG